MWQGMDVVKGGPGGLPPGKTNPSLLGRRLRRSSGDQEISLISYGQEIQEVQKLLSGVETREEIEEVLRRSGNLLNLLWTGYP